MNTKQKMEEILLNDFECFDDFTVDKLLNLFGVSDSFISKFQEIIYSDLSDSEIVNALHRLDKEFTNV